MPGRGGPAPLFAALGDPHRLRIVGTLALRGPQTVVRLTQGSGITRQAVRKHVGVLERAGIVHSARRGRERLVRLESPRLEDAERYLADVSAEWDGALDRLRRMVEG